MNSPDEVKQLVEEALKGNPENFGKLLPGTREKFLGRATKAFEELERVALRLKETYPESRRTDSDWKAVQYSWQLLWGAFNALIGGFTLLERGYPGETLAVARVSMERLLVAILLFDNHDLTPRFESGKLDHLKGVGLVSKILPDFGEVWGMLSDLGTHVSPANVGTIVVEHGDKLSLLRIGGHIGGDETETVIWEREANIYLWLAGILATAPEQIYFNPKRRNATVRKKK